MNNFVVLNLNNDNIIGYGITPKHAVESVEITNDFCDDLEADQIGLYQEVQGVFSVRGLAFELGKQNV